MQGHGTLVFADGDKYEGGWKENEQNGQGTHTYTSGGWSSGEWYNVRRSLSRLLLLWKLCWESMV